MGCVAKNGETLLEQVRDMGFDETEEAEAQENFCN